MRPRTRTARNYTLLCERTTSSLLSTRGTDAIGRGSPRRDTRHRIDLHVAMDLLGPGGNQNAFSQVNLAKNVLRKIFLFLLFQSVSCILFSYFDLFRNFVSVGFYNSNQHHNCEYFKKKSQNIFARLIWAKRILMRASTPEVHLTALTGIGLVHIFIVWVIFWCKVTGLLPGGLLDGPTPKKNVSLEKKCCENISPHRNPVNLRDWINLHTTLLLRNVAANNVNSEALFVDDGGPKFIVLAPRSVRIVIKLRMA